MATKKRMERAKHSKRAQRDAEYQRMVDTAAEGFRQAFKEVSINLNIEQLVGRVDVTTLHGLQDSDLHALRERLVQQLIECCITALGSFQQHPQNLTGRVILGYALDGTAKSQCLIKASKEKRMFAQKGVIAEREKIGTNL